jgi:regulator-associated protein of mTOR
MTHVPSLNNNKCPPPHTQADLVKDNGHLYFLKYLDAPEPSIDNNARAQAAFVLAVVCDGHSKGQALCAAANLLQVRGPLGFWGGWGPGWPWEQLLGV